MLKIFSSKYDGKPCMRLSKYYHNLNVVHQVVKLRVYTLLKYLSDFTLVEKYNITFFICESARLLKYPAVLFQIYCIHIHDHKSSRKPISCFFYLFLVYRFYLLFVSCYCVATDNLGEKISYVTYMIFIFFP